MPIYVYKCSSCGFAKDVLQKMSDAPLTVCPSCGQATFSKQLTAAGFQLKGSGWYVTDFRDGHNGSASSGSHHADSSGDEAVKSEGAASPSASEAAPAPAASAAPATSAASAAPPDSGSSASND